MSTCRIRWRSATPPKKPQGTDTYCWRPTEVDAILKHCETPELEWLRQVIIGLAATGLRISELMLLHWTDIKIRADHFSLYPITAMWGRLPACHDFCGAMISPAGWKPTPRGFEIASAPAGPPSRLGGIQGKVVCSKEGKRWITLTDETTKASRRGQEKRTTKSGRDRTFPVQELLGELLETMSPHSDGRVFHGPLGGKIKANTVRRSLIRDVLTPLSLRFPSPGDEPGFIDGPLHSFRHYFCSICANHGVKERVLMNWLGHRSSQMVHRHYHLHDEEAVRQMQQVNLF